MGVFKDRRSGLEGLGFRAGHPYVSPKPQENIERFFQHWGIYQSSIIHARSIRSIRRSNRLNANEGCPGSCFAILGTRLSLMRTLVGRRALNTGGHRRGCITNRFNYLINLKDLKNSCFSYLVCNLRLDQSKRI